jgi:PAS domain S-box-containing protein
MLPDTPRLKSRLELLYLAAREFNIGLDINEVLYRVLSATVATVGASDASLFLLDEEGRLENFFLISGFVLQERSKPTVEAILDRGLVAWVKENRQGAVINNTSEDERWYADDDNPEIRQAGSAISVPIQLPDQLIGVLTITAPQPDFFEASDLSMLTVIADQAAFAISNARLFQAEQHRRRLADTLASVARTINSTLNLNEVLELILEHLALVVDHDTSSILLCGDDGCTLSVRAARGFGADTPQALAVTLPLDDKLPNYQVVIQQKPIVISDVQAEPNWINHPSTRKVRSWIGAPLITRGQVLGMLTVDSFKADQYTPENAQEVAAFADQAATAVANAQAVTLLQNAEASYTALFEDSTDAIIITDYQGRILNVNRKTCHTLRRPKGKFIGSEITLVAPGLAAYLQGERAQELRAGAEISLEIELVDACDEPLALEINARQVHYGGRDCVQWAGRDISARKEAERMRQDLINMVIHDLRGPLGNVINSLDLLAKLLETTESSPQLNYVLGIAKRSGQEVSDLIDSMLDISRLEQGEVPLQIQAVRLDSLFEAVARQVTPRAKAKQISLTLAPLPADLPTVWLDENMIRRVLINLLDNAIKYTPRSGRVSLTTTLEGALLHFAVVDNGPGINQTDQPYVFDKFSRVNYSGEGPGGVGLGLAFCKLAVEAHQGRIWLESSGVPGEGTTFFVTIPLADRPSDA